MRNFIGLCLLLFSFAKLEAQALEGYLDKPVFQLGESVQFNIHFNWGFIWVHAGDVDFTVEAKRWKGEDVYLLKAVGRTVKTFERMYTIRDTFEAYIDTVSLLPLYYQEAKHEDRYYGSATYHYKRGEKKTTVKADFARKTRKWSDTLEIDNNTFDLITTCYRIRNLNIEKLTLNQTIPFPMLFDNEVYALGLTYKGKETIKLKNGKKYNALKFVPKLITGDLFKKEEDMTIYVSDDANRVPLLVEAKIKVGYIKAMLADVKNTREPMTSVLPKK